MFNKCQHLQISCEICEKIRNLSEKVVTTVGTVRFVDAPLPSWVERANKCRLGFYARTGPSAAAEQLAAAGQCINTLTL